ncbi:MULTISPECIES: RNA polymerase sigma factor [unclassified Saccharothrix]|uniref:RNA polymerase sigma factor n=1 Tax=unclassified Saccharothrix TaxID=2593673 RepID=UPI00307DF945
MGDDHRGFDEYFRGDHARLVAFVVKLGHGLQDAEDVAAEAMTQLYVQWDVVRQPQAWVRLVARRLAARRARREVERVVREELAGRAAPVVDQPSVEVENALWLAGVLDALGTREREVLVLTLEGFTTWQIAEHLGIEPATVRSHLRRARQRLKGHPVLAVALPEQGRTDG